MELRIKPAAGNKYERRALLVKGAAPLLWFRELEALKVNIKDIEAFAIPSDRANVLYGCLLVFNKGLPKDIRNHKCFQCAYNKFFIPENAVLYPQLTAKDIASVKARWVIAHPDFGFVDLDTPIDWLELIAEVPETELELRQPLEGITISDKILGFSVEMDEEDLANSLLPQKTEEEWMKDLPFNLQKVLNGNKKEAEKYLQYLAKYPERALALGVPLNVMNTSRDSGWASFNFRSGWLQSMFGGSGFSSGGSGSGGGGFFGRNFGSGGSGSSAWRYLKFIAIGLAVVLFIGRLFDTNNRIGVDKSVGPLPRAATGPVNTSGSQYEGVPSVSPQTTGSKSESKDTLENEVATLRAKYLVAVYKQGSPEIRNNRALKDSIRLQMNELQRKIGSLSEQIAARDAAIRKDNLKKVETVLANAENRLGPKIRDSIAKLPQQDTQSAGGRNVLYQLALESKKAWLRDSLELAYGLRSVQQDTFTPRAAEFPDYEAPVQQKGITGQIIFMIIVFLFVVFIFTKMIRGKTISMGGSQLSFGMKTLLLLAFVGLLAYILYPLIGRYGYNWLVWLILLAAAALLYRLLASDKTILKSDKNG